MDKPRLRVGMTMDEAKEYVLLHFPNTKYERRDLGKLEVHRVYIGDMEIIMGATVEDAWLRAAKHVRCITE